MLFFSSLFRSFTAVSVSQCVPCSLSLHPQAEVALHFKAGGKCLSFSVVICGRSSKTVRCYSLNCSVAHKDLGREVQQKGSFNWKLSMTHIMFE